jgi:hypothetical protein
MLEKYFGKDLDIFGIKKKDNKVEVENLQLHDEKNELQKELYQNVYVDLLKSIDKPIILNPYLKKDLLFLKFYSKSKFQNKYLNFVRKLDGLARMCMATEFVISYNKIESLSIDFNEPVSKDKFKSSLHEYKSFFDKFSYLDVLKIDKEKVNVGFEEIEYYKGKDEMQKELYHNIYKNLSESMDESKSLKTEFKNEIKFLKSNPKDIPKVNVMCAFQNIDYLARECVGRQFIDNYNESQSFFVYFSEPVLHKKLEKNLRLYESFFNRFLHLDIRSKSGQDLYKRNIPIID